jgi:hypothetical protein
VNDAFAISVWAAVAARIVFWAFERQTTRLAPVMIRIRKGLVPATLVLAGFAPFASAHSMPGSQWASGSARAESAPISAMKRDGVSLDEAVARAEKQYRARVVRTDVQDEDGRKVYVLKLLSEDGRVFTVRIDAATGRMR